MNSRLCLDGKYAACICLKTIACYFTKKLKFKSSCQLLKKYRFEITKEVNKHIVAHVTTKLLCF